MARMTYNKTGIYKNTCGFELIIKFPDNLKKSPKKNRVIKFAIPLLFGNW